MNWFIATGVIANIAVVIGAIVAIRRFSTVERQRREDRQTKLKDRDGALIAQVHEALEDYLNFDLRPIGGDDEHGLYLNAEQDRRQKELYRLVFRIAHVAHRLTRFLEVREVLYYWLYERAALVKARNGEKDVDGAVELQNRLEAFMRSKNTTG